MYTCNINYLPPQLLIFGPGTVVVTNPVKVVLVKGIVCVHVCVCVYAHASLYAYDLIGSVIDRVRGECGSVHESIQVPAC